MLPAVADADEATDAPVDEQRHQISVTRITVHHIADLRAAQILRRFAAHIDEHLAVAPETPEDEEHGQQQHDRDERCPEPDIQGLRKGEIRIGQVDLDGRQLIGLQRLRQIAADDIAADRSAQRILHIPILAGAGKHFLRIKCLGHMNFIMQMLDSRIHARHKCPIQHLRAFRQLQVRGLHGIRHGK